MTFRCLAERDDARIKAMDQGADGPEVQRAFFRDVQTIFHSIFLAIQDFRPCHFPDKISKCPGGSTVSDMIGKNVAVCPQKNEMLTVRDVLSPCLPAAADRNPGNVHPDSTVSLLRACCACDRCAPPV